MTKYEINQEYAKREKLLKKAAKKNDKITMGAQLHWIRENRECISLLDGYKNVYDYAADMIGTKKTTTSNMVATAEAFCERDDDGWLTSELKIKYRKFTFSQLNEMRQLSESELKSITADASVRDIRAIHKPVTEKRHGLVDEIADAAASLGKEEQEILLKLAKTMLAARQNDSSGAKIVKFA